MVLKNCFFQNRSHHRHCKFSDIRKKKKKTKKILVKENKMFDIFRRIWIGEKKKKRMLCRLLKIWESNFHLIFNNISIIKIRLVIFYFILYWILTSSHYLFFLIRNFELFYLWISFNSHADATLLNDLLFDNIFVINILCYLQNVFFFTFSCWW